VAEVVATKRNRKRRIKRRKDGSRRTMRKIRDCKNKDFLQLLGANAHQILSLYAYTYI